MKPLTLALRAPTPFRIDMRAFTPDTLDGRTLREIQSIPVHLGKQAFEAGELFAISGEDVRDIRIHPEAGKLDAIASAMSGGAMIVDGDAGMHAGEQLRGGSLRITGSAGPYSAAGMRAGEVLIEGDSGDFAGAALPGEKQGMTGGTLVIRGGSGARLGDRLRRGVIVVRGGAGDYCGSRMTAGTIAVGGRCGTLAACGMKRGTLLLAQEPDSVPATFCDNGQQSLPFMTLLLRELLALSDAFEGARAARAVHRYLGDRACGGLGEILVLPGA